MPLSEYALVYRDGVNTHLAQTVHCGTLYGVPVIEGYRAVAVDDTLPVTATFVHW